MKSVIKWMWVSIPTAITVTMHSDRLALSSASCMANAPTARGQNDVQIQDEGSSLSKLQINNQGLRTGTLIEGMGQGGGAAGGLTIATRRALPPLALTTLPAVVPTSTDSMSEHHTTSTTTHDLNRSATQEGTSLCSAIMENKGSPVKQTVRSEASTQEEEVSSDIARPNQASQGGNPCQSPSEGNKEQTDLFHIRQALTSNCLRCGHAPGGYTRCARLVGTLYCNLCHLKSFLGQSVQSVRLRRRWVRKPSVRTPSSARKVLQDVRRVRRSVTSSAPTLTLTVDHFSRHLLHLQNDCLLTCVHGTTTLCLRDLSMLAFTAAELKVVQSLDHWGRADHWEHYCQNGPILNVASLLYFLLLLPEDALHYMDRARLVWFVDMVLYYKYEAVRVLQYVSAFDQDVSMLPESMNPNTNYTIMIEQMQRPALAYFISDVQSWFSGWQHHKSSKWLLLVARTCVKLRAAVSPMIQQHARSRPLTHRPLRLQPFVQHILLSLQPQLGPGLGVHPTCQPLSPFVSSATEPPFVTSGDVMRRQANALKGLPRPQGQLADEHNGVLLDHFSRHGIFRLQNDCLLLSQQELAAEHSSFLLEHFSLHNFLDLEDDCLRPCVGITSTLCFNDMGMLAFTASELRMVQSLRHCGPADQWRHYCQHGPILNEASLLYFLLLLPLDALCLSHRASLVWFVDMVLYHKFESVRILRSSLDDMPGTDGAQHVLDFSYTLRVERLQRPALALLIRDVQSWFPGWQQLRSARWILMCASTCVRLEVSLSPMIRRLEATMPAGTHPPPLSKRPFVEQVILSLQQQHGALQNNLSPTCPELEPFVSYAGGPARVSSSNVQERMDDASASLPRPQEMLAAEHTGFLLEHFSQHGSGDTEHACGRCGNVVDINCVEHIYNAGQLVFCSEECYEASLPASYVRDRFQRRALNPRAHPYSRGPHGGNVNVQVLPTIHGSDHRGPLPARIVAAAYEIERRHRATIPEWLRVLTMGTVVLRPTLQFPRRSPFGGAEQQVPLLALPADARLAILRSCFTSCMHTLVPMAPDHWQDRGIIQVAKTLRLWVLSQRSQSQLCAIPGLLSTEVKTNFVQFLDVVIAFMGHTYHACGSSCTRVVREKLVKMSESMESHHDLAITRLAALHYRCRALASSRYLYWRRCYMLHLSQVSRAIRHLIHGQLRSERGMISDAFDVCCPGSLLDDLTTTGPTLDRYSLVVCHSATEEINLSLELLQPHWCRQLWAGLHQCLSLQAMMPRPRSSEEIEQATFHALRATSPAQVTSEHPAAIQTEDAASPPEVCTELPSPPDTPSPAPDLDVLELGGPHPGAGRECANCGKVWVCTKEPPEVHVLCKACSTMSPDLQLSDDGHVSPDWNPPGSPHDIRIDVLVTGLNEDACITVAVGAWSGIHLRMACCQHWCVPLNSASLHLYEWRGSLGELIDLDPLEAAVGYSDNTVVNVTLRDHLAASDLPPPAQVCACSPRCTQEFECEGCGWSKACRKAVEEHEAACSSYHEQLGVDALAVLPPGTRAEAEPRWCPPGGGAGRKAIIVVTALIGRHMPIITVAVDVGTWSVLDLRNACCLQWEITLTSTSMCVCRWQGALAPLDDEDGLDDTLSYINGAASVHVMKRGFRTTGGTPIPRRVQRLQLSNSGYKAGDCFIAAVLMHMSPLPRPTPSQIAHLRAEAGLPAEGSATQDHMMQLLRHLSCCCVLVQPNHQSAVVLNGGASTSRCITMVMQGNRHVEPVSIHGTVELRSLDEVASQLQVCGIQLQLPASGPENSLEEAVSISDDDKGQADNPDSVSYPCPCYCCTHECDCVCCVEGEPFISRFGYHLWKISEFSKARFFQCEHCEHHLFTCLRRARVHTITCRQYRDRKRNKRAFAPGESVDLTGEGASRALERDGAELQAPPAAELGVAGTQQAERGADLAPCGSCGLRTRAVNLCIHALCKACCASTRCCSKDVTLNPRPPLDDDPAQGGPPRAPDQAVAGTLPAKTVDIGNQEQSKGPAPGNSRGAKKRRRLAKLKLRRMYQRMQAAPPQSPTAEVQMMGGDITGSCLDNGLGDPDDHMLARQQAGLDDETLQLVQMLAALPEQKHYLRDRNHTVSEWPNDITSSDDEPAPEVQHVLCQPNSTVMLRRKGDDMWLGEKQLTQHVNDSGTAELCALAAHDMMSPRMPWRQQWQYIGSRKLPEPRLSCVVAWTKLQTLYHGRNPGTSRHCLPSGFASIGTIDDLPASVKRLAVHVMTQTPAKKYNFLDTPHLILVQANGYRPESLAFWTKKHAEGMVGHTDGPSVDQSMPKIHVYVKMDGTLIIILKTNKEDSHQIIGRQGSFTMLLPGDEEYIKHGRTTTMAPGSTDFAITLVLRLMHPQKGTNAAADVMSGATVLTTPNRVSDWENLAESKILTCRTIMGQVPWDRSIRQILEQNPGLLIPATQDCSHFSPGDIITSSAGSEMLSLEPSVLMGSVKGSSAAGGAVAIYLNHDYVTILERSTVAGGTVRFIFDAGRHRQNTTLMQLSLSNQNTIRCLTNTTRWPALKEPILYLGDALVHSRFPFCNSSYWDLSFTVLQSAITVVVHWLDKCSQSALQPSIPRVIDTHAEVPTYHHWEIKAGSFGSYTQADSSDWTSIGLNGNDRWMKIVRITLSDHFKGYSVIQGNMLRNLDRVKNSKRNAKPQRRDQDLHCDLPAGVFGLDLTQDHIIIKDKIRDQVLGLIQPNGEHPVYLAIRCSATNRKVLVTIEPGHYIVFSATRCMHAGYGGRQGDRLHAMIMPSALCGQFKDHILEEAKHVLLASQVTGKDKSEWVFKDTRSNTRNKL